MKKYLKWIGIGFLALVVIGIFLPDDNAEENTDSEENTVSETDIDSVAIVNPEPPAEVIHWKKGQFTDEFGDSTGNVFLKYTDFNASFSNSAATNRGLTVKIFLEKDIFWMRFDEYQNGSVESFSYYDDWNGTAKFEDGTKRTESLDVNDRSLEFSRRFSSQVIEELLDSNVVKFYLYDDYSTRYSFEINGFNGLSEGIEEYGW